MKLPKIKLTPGARVKANHHPSEGAGSNIEAPAGQAVPPVRVSAPGGRSLPTSRWGIHEPKPLPATKATEPAKASASGRWVRFELVAPEARTVFLVGSFNNWNRKAAPMMRLHDLKWAKELWLPPGRYEYLFVVNGNYWATDPKARDYASNPFGAYNSVLEVSTSA